MPYLGEQVVQPASARPPLIIITTNEERELPGAFLRRCMVLRLELPGEDSALRKLLGQRATAHFGGRVSEDALAEAIRRRAPSSRCAAQRPISRSSKG